MTITLNRRHALGGLAAAASLPFIGGVRAAGNPVQLLSHRYPALEFYAEELKNAIPGVEVNAQLMPVDKQIEMATIALSSQSSSVDLVYVSTATVNIYASKGWLMPLDDLWEKHKEEFNLGDLNPQVVSEYNTDGVQYALPTNSITMILAYRGDLFEQAGVAPPKTMDEYVQIANQLNSPARAGTILNLKPGDAIYHEVHWHLNAQAEGWFDADWHPVFNSARAVEALQTVKDLTRVAQPGYLNAFADETTIALQQDAAVQGHSYSTRARTFDDPAKSMVVDKMQFVGLPGGGGRRHSDGYAISAFTKQDPDLLFRLIATASREEAQRRAAQLIVPTRLSLLNDPELISQLRHYPACLEGLKAGVPLPPLPEIYAVGDFISRRIHQALTDELQIKEALDLAAKETEDFLRNAGYYKAA